MHGVSASQAPELHVPQPNPVFPPWVLHLRGWHPTPSPAMALTILPDGPAYLISQLLKNLSFSGIYEESDHPVNSPSLASNLLCDLRHRTAPLGCAVKSGEPR